MCKSLRQWWPTAILLVSVLAPSDPATASNKSRVEAYPVADGLIEVIADFSENAIYWCGAATYARRTGAGGSEARLYIWRGPSASTVKPGETAVRFGLRPPPNGPATGVFTNDVSIIGNSLSVAQANQACNERTASG